MSSYFRVLLLSLLVSSYAQGFEGHWSLGKASAIELQGFTVVDGKQCETLNLEVTQSHVQFKLKCGSLYHAKMYSIGKGKGNVRVQKDTGTLLITKYGYFGHKVQTRRDTVKMLNIPFVNEVLRIENIDGDTVSLFHEKFMTDALGRIVTQSSVQAIEMEKTSKPEKDNKVIKLNSRDKITAREKRRRRPKRI